MRHLVLILVLTGCGSSAAGERITADADPPPDASADTSTGAAGAGGAAGSAAGGTSGAAGAAGAGGATATSCLIPETAITAVASGATLSVTGGKTSSLTCNMTYSGQTYMPGIYQGEVITGTPFSSGWSVVNYTINPSTVDPTMCAAYILFRCVGCAGVSCGDATMAVNLTLPPQ